MEIDEDKLKHALIETLINPLHFNKKNLKS